MHKIDGEQISELADGETPPGSREAVVAALLDAGQDAQDRFSRYRFIGEVMRDEAAHPVDVASAVRAALQNEPTVLAPPRREIPAWLRPAAGIAVAASVAAAAIVVGPQMLVDERPGAVLAPSFVSTAPPLAVRPQFVVSTPDALAIERRSVGQLQGTAQWRTLDPDLAERLNRLVIEHHEFAGRSGVTGPVPHIGVVSYGVE